MNLGVANCCCSLGAIASAASVGELMVHQLAKCTGEGWG